MTAWSGSMVIDSEVKSVQCNEAAVMLRAENTQLA